MHLECVILMLRKNEAQQSHVEVRDSLYRHEIELPDDSHESILAMKERTKILRDTILQRDVELIVLRVVCTESMVRLSSIEEQLDSLMGQQKKHTITFQSSPL